MENIEEKITEVLNDPEKMSQILSIAQNLGLSPNGDETMNTPQNNEALSSVINMLQSSPSRSKQEALMQALLPFLRPGRQEKLQKALRLSRISQLAGIALKQYADMN